MRIMKIPAGNISRRGSVFFVDEKVHVQKSTDGFPCSVFQSVRLL
jgi:hypothetical protein